MPHRAVKTFPEKTASSKANQPIKMLNIIDTHESFAVAVVSQVARATHSLTQFQQLVMKMAKHCYEISCMNHCQVQHHLNYDTTHSNLK